MLASDNSQDNAMFTTCSLLSVKLRHLQKLYVCSGPEDVGGYGWYTCDPPKDYHVLMLHSNQTFDLFDVRVYESELRELMTSLRELMSFFWRLYFALIEFKH